jgi:dTDP-4-dehydrorhamnose 3,5-epimerase
MNILTSGIGCLVIPRKIFADERGTFQEAFKESEYSFLPGLKQINIATSKAGVVRGFHLQHKNPQGKLIRVLSGEAVACIIDLRKNSPLYGQTESFPLTKDSHALYVPPGFGNSYWTLTDVVYHYICTEEYDPSSDHGVNPLDSKIDSPWKDKEIILSEKDKKLPLLEDFRPSFEYSL